MDASSRLLKTCEETRELIAESLKRRLPSKRQVEESCQPLESTHSSKRVRSNATVESDHSASQGISASAAATTAAPAIVLDREAFRKRLESFTDAFITRSRPVNAVQCAMHGFIDTRILEGPKQDICKLVCEVCQGTNYVIDLINLNPTNHRLQSIHDTYMTGLLLFHKDSCVWRKHQCPPQIYSFPRATHHEAIEKIRKEGKELLQYGVALPAIENPLNPEQLKKLEYFIRDAENPAARYEFSSTPPSPLLQDVWTSYTLPLFGWQLLDNGTLKCSCCFRQIRSDQFNGSEHERFDVVKEHRDYCPWINSSSAQIAPPRPSPFVKSVCGHEWMVATIELEYEILLKLKDESPVYQSSRAQWLKSEQQRIKRERKWLSQAFPDSSRVTPDNNTSPFELVPTIPQSTTQAETHTAVPMEQHQHKEKQQEGTILAVHNTEVDDEKKTEVPIAVSGETKRDVEDLMATDASHEVPQFSNDATKDVSVSFSDQGSGDDSQNRHDELTDNNEMPLATNLGELSEAKADTRNVEGGTPLDTSSLLVNETDTLPKTLTVVASPLPNHPEGDLGDLLDSEAGIEAEDTDKKESLTLEVTEETAEAAEDDLGEEFDECILDEVDKMEDLETPTGEQHNDHDDELYLEAAEAGREQTEAMEVDGDPQKHMNSGKTPSSVLDDLDDEIEELSKSTATNGADDKEELLIEETEVECTEDDLEANVEGLSNTTDLDNTGIQASTLADEQLLEMEETEIEITPQSPASAADLLDEDGPANGLDDIQLPQTEDGEHGEDVQSQSIVTEVETPLNYVGTPNVEGNLDDTVQSVAVEVEEVEVQETASEITEDPEKNDDRRENIPAPITIIIGETAGEEMALVEQENLDIEKQEMVEINEVSTEDTSTEMAKNAEALTAGSNLSSHDVDYPMEEANVPKEADTAMDEIQSELDLGEHATETVLSTAPVPEPQEDKSVDSISEKDQELEDATFITNLADDDYLNDDNEEQKQDATAQSEGDQSTDGAVSVEESIDQDVASDSEDKKTLSPTSVGDDIYGEVAQDASSHHEEHLDEDERVSPSANAESEDAEVAEIYESLAGPEGEEHGKAAQDLTSTQEIDEKERGDVLDDSKAGEETTLEVDEDTLLPPGVDEPAEDHSPDHDINEDTRNTSGDGDDLLEQVAQTDSTMAKDLQEDV